MFLPHRKKLWMERKLSPGVKKVKEMHLFHGTNENSLAGICQQGFDWRLSGTSVGTLYGKGTYFHKEAKYSSCYTDSRTLIMARVLVGDFVQGVSKYVRPPGKDPRDPHGDLYDSCVDNPAAPKIFVIFSQEQCYPEYLIKYWLDNIIPANTKHLYSICTTTYNARPTSKTLGRRCTNVLQVFCVFWDTSGGFSSYYCSVVLLLCMKMVPNKPGLIKCSHSVPVISDHCGVVTKLDIEPPFRRTKPRPVRQLRNAD